ncbi:MAG: hypothetical protein M3Q51_00370 [Pseudomonadota bacterium]|nr:hypothetical protein [Pseudomonadota bacterium]
MNLIEEAFDSMFPSIQAPNWNVKAMQANRRTDTEANAYAQANKVARAKQYRDDPLKRAEVISDWLHTPMGRQASKLIDTDLTEFAHRTKSALDRGLLELAAQDLMDEYTLGDMA